MIRRQLHIPASPELLWEALTDPEHLEGWFGGVFTWELTEGSPLHFRGDDGESRRGMIDAVRDGRHLRFSWWPEEQPEDASEVSYLIEPEDGGARLTVQERPLVAPSAIRQPSACLNHLASTGSWTPWDTRLAGAWAGIASGAEPARAGGGPSLRARV